MESQAQYDATGRYFEQLRANIRHDSNCMDMGKSDRKDLVVQFLAETRLALPPAVLYRNLRLRQNATFSEKSLSNYLTELEEDGLVKRVDPEALASREVVAVGENERGYYLITEAGVEAAPDVDSLQQIA